MTGLRQIALTAFAAATLGLASAGANATAVFGVAGLANDNVFLKATLVSVPATVFTIVNAPAAITVDSSSANASTASSASPFGGFGTGLSAEVHGAIHGATVGAPDFQSANLDGNTGFTLASAVAPATIVEVLLEWSYDLTASVDDLVNEFAQMSLTISYNAGADTVNLVNLLNQTGPVSASGTETVLISLAPGTTTQFTSGFQLSGSADANEFAIPNEIPEPSTLALLLAGLTLCAVRGARRT